MPVRPKPVPAKAGPAHSPWLSTTLGVAGMVAIAVLARWLPHPPNFTPLGALALFGGAIAGRQGAAGRRWIAGAAVLATMLISDAMLGFHPLMPVVYGCLLVNVWLGHRYLSGHGDGFVGAGRTVATSLMGSVVFFLVTNLACWVWMYPPTWAGLAACYASAVPFFQYTLTGDLIYSGILFGTLSLCRGYLPHWRRATQFA